MSETKVSQHYVGKQGEEYARVRLSDADHPAFAINFSRFQPYLKSTDSVLDFGCGNGGMLRLMKSHVARLEGLEVNPAAAEMARQAGVKIHESLAELPKTPTFDIVVSNQVFEHVRDVCATLEELRRSIKPGGKLVVIVPIDDWRLRHQRRWSKDDIDRHLQTWTPRLFANVLYESGYEVDECRVMNLAWHPRIFPLMRIGLGWPAMRAASIIGKRRNVLAVGRVPVSIT